MAEKILVINPGSTSTKIALFDGENQEFVESVDHPAEVIGSFKTIPEQLDMRTDVVWDTLKEHSVSIDGLDAVIGRGGMLYNIEAGGYKVNDDMVTALMIGQCYPHASNLGALIASRIASQAGIPAFISDCVTADEWDDIARISGSAALTRVPGCHVLNQKAVGRIVAGKYNRSYDEMNMVILHMGGGVSVGAHDHGRIVDNVRDDEGAFSPQRTGELPLMQFLQMAEREHYSIDQLKSMVRGKGGVTSYLGTADMREVEKRAGSGDEKAKQVLDAFIYQVSKDAGAMASVLSFDVDCIVLTGGIAYSEYVTSGISARIGKIAPVEIVPGEDEMNALSSACLAMLRGEMEIKEYKLEQ